MRCNALAQRPGPGLVWPARRAAYECKDRNSMKKSQAVPSPPAGGEGSPARKEPDKNCHLKSTGNV